MILSSSSLSAVTAKPSIIEEIDFNCGTDSTSFPLADKLRKINLWYYKVVTAILEAMSNWEWDDTNKTDYPIGTTNLVASQRDYTLPTDFLKISRVEVKDSGGNYQKVEEFDETQIYGIGLSEFNETDGLPVYYREIGNSIELYPSPSASSTTLTAGLKLYFVRSQTEFTISDAAVSPGFSTLFHKILALGPSYDYAAVKLTAEPRIAANLLADLNGELASLKKYYATRNREKRTRMSRKRTNYE